MNHEKKGNEEMKKRFSQFETISHKTEKSEGKANRQIVNWQFGDCDEDGRKDKDKGRQRFEGRNSFIAKKKTQTTDQPANQPTSQPAHALITLTQTLGTGHSTLDFDLRSRSPVQKRTFYCCCCCSEQPDESERHFLA